MRKAWRDAGRRNLNDSLIQDAQSVKVTQNPDRTTQGFYSISIKKAHRDCLSLPKGFEEWRLKRIERARLWNLKHKEQAKSKRKSYLGIVRREVIAAYGNKCKCCSESIFEFLTIDHINGNGKADRLEKNGTYGLYKWLKKNGYPKDNYRCLCMNCNWAIRSGDKCPHGRRKSS